MTSPSKKRRTNSGSSKPVPSKTLEFFFSKQQKGLATVNPGPNVNISEDNPKSKVPLTDEEYARQLQAKFDREANTISKHDSSTVPPETSTLVSEGKRALSIDQEVIDPVLAKSKEGEAISAKTLTLQSTSAVDEQSLDTLPLDQGPLVFDTERYLPELKQQWAAQKSQASYSLLIRCFVLVNGTTSRIKIVDTLVNCLRLLIEGDPQSLLPAVWLATNAIAPPYESLELGLGSSAISKALRKACGLDSRALKTLYNKHGDAGDVAFEAKKKQSFTLRKPQPLTIKDVYSSLVKIAKSRGQGSSDIKQSIVDRLLQNVRGGEESRYLVRTLCQHLRIGAVKTTMLIALSRAFLLSKPSRASYDIRPVDELSKLKKEDLSATWLKAEEIVKGCFARRPNYADIIPVLLDIGVTDELAIRCNLSLHTPLGPMLGSITRDLSDMLVKLQGRKFACEFKYDGQRAQVHCDDTGKVSIFSRHLENMTDKYPDLVALMPRIRGESVKSFIMEGEVVAVDAESGELKNFQTLSNRARKDVEIGTVKIQVCLFAFDLMFLNGKSLLDQQFRERRNLLKSLFTEVPRQFTWVKSIDASSSDSEAVLEFFKLAIDTKCEGIMVKLLEENQQTVSEDVESADIEQTAKPKGKHKALLATYEPDKRLESWLKVKKDYTSSFETLDLIPVAAWHGSGRKSKWWSPILMALRNEETGSLEVVCKCMSGFTDAFYKENRAFYVSGSANGHGVGQNVRKEQPAFVEYRGPMPDVWFEPQEVWEMAFADITLSPTYLAAIGLVSDERGLSLRFPRFIKKREDKGLEEASTGEVLAELFRKQEMKAPAPVVEPDEDVDE